MVNYLKEKFQRTNVQLWKSLSMLLSSRDSFPVCKVKKVDGSLSLSTQLLSL